MTNSSISTNFVNCKSKAGDENQMLHLAEIHFNYSAITTVGDKVYGDPENKNQTIRIAFKLDPKRVPNEFNVYDMMKKIVRGYHIFALKENDYDRQIAKRIVFMDGFNISIQASSTHYCEPRQNMSDFGVYSSYECGYPSEYEACISSYAEMFETSDFTHSIYPYTPVELIFALILIHDKGSEILNDSLKYWGILDYNISV